MNILYALTAYYPSVGGSQVHWHAIGDVLARRGHNVCAVTQWKDQPTHYLLDSTLWAPWGDDEYDVGPIHVYRFQPTAWQRMLMIPFLAGYYVVPELCARPVGRFFARKTGALPRSFDLVHSIRVGREHISWAAYDVARRRGVPFCITPNLSPRMQTPLGRFTQRNFFRLLRRSDGVFVFTEAEKQFVLSLGVEESRVCVLGIGPVLSESYDAAAFQVQYGIRGRMVLFLGQKLPYKGYDALMGAAPRVWAKHPDVSFVFMGPHHGKSRDVIRGLDDPRIVDIPLVPPRDPLKASALAACDIFALPSRQEGIGGVYIEAWAMGKPVIACRIPFLVIDDGKDGLLVEQTAEDVAEKIIWLLDHSPQAVAMGVRGRSKVERIYNWPSICSTVESFYSTLIERAKGRQGSL